MLLPDVLQDRHAGDPRHPVIEQRTIKDGLAQLGQGVMTIFGGLHPVPAIREALLKDASEIRIVIDDQNAFPQHGSALSDHLSGASAPRILFFGTRGPPRRRETGPVSVTEAGVGSGK